MNSKLPLVGTGEKDPETGEEKMEVDYKAAEKQLIAEQLDHYSPEELQRFLTKSTDPVGLIDDHITTLTRRIDMPGKFPHKIDIYRNKLAQLEALRPTAVTLADAMAAASETRAEEAE